MSASYVTPVLTYPGITLPKSAMITRSNSTRPGIALINAVPMTSDAADTSGTASFTFGTSSYSMTWTNCLCDVGTIVRTSRGFVSRYVIFDRRWRWQKGTPVTGAYNVRNPDNSIISGTSKTLAQLATILFTACGESGADVSLITSSEKPFVVWDRDNPADELAELLETRGYVISLQADETVKVFPKGTGAILPVNDDVATVSVTIDPPEVPDTIYAVGNKTYCQSMLKFIPVGIDTDGTVKKTQDLSYSPGFGTTGFEGLELKDFAYITDPVAQDLARQYVGKLYQLDQAQYSSFSLHSGSVDYVPGEITVSDMSQILPLQEFILSTYTDQYGQNRYQQAYVVGTFWQGNQPENPVAKETTPDFTRVDERSWSWVDLARGIIKFNYPAIKDDGTGKKVPADVYVVCAYSIHPSDTLVKDRFVRAKSLGGYGYDVFKVDELQRNLIVNYTAGTSTISSITDNVSTINGEADDFLNAAALRYVTQVANVVTYRDCYAFGTDGVNLQVQWFIGAGHSIPFATIASQYAEALPFVPTSNDRQDKRTIRRQPDATNQRKQKWKRGQYGTEGTGFE